MLHAYHHILAKQTYKQKIKYQISSMYIYQQAFDQHITDIHKDLTEEWKSFLHIFIIREI